MFLEFNGETGQTDGVHIADAIKLQLRRLQEVFTASLTTSSGIRPEGGSFILNILYESVAFTTCESMKMSRQVDKVGQRTIAVVTKAYKVPEGLLEKVTADDVNIGLDAQPLKFPTINLSIRWSLELDRKLVLQLSPTSSDPNGGKIEKMFEEGPSAAAKRCRLSVKLLMDASCPIS
ncbi:hypothetical protein SADUNF_Sadunf03G0101800 [Salix dunnii]|uniref:Uncharacterized protein n=1 Tax=Salix dunnii TaxID=1413687 RepID=A0A835K850_9ROSI|nr:hypothetical protein SADUNF_Sadunf03G0101800 [Salix dunnii]